jgi:hypothetical protein
MTDNPTYTKPNDERFFAAVGRYTISWAFLETAIDHMVFASHTWAGGNEIEPEMPWAIDRKIKFLRKSFKRLPGFQPFAVEGEMILNDAKKASDNRHDIIHGVITDHPEDATIVKMVRLMREKSGRSFKEYHVSTGGIEREAVDTNLLGNHALKLARRIVDAVGPPDAK